MNKSSSLPFYWKFSSLETVLKKYNKKYKMRHHPSCVTFLYFKLNLVLLLVIMAINTQAQVPEGIPDDFSKVRIDSTFDIIVYIVLPVLMLAYFFLVAKKV